MHCSLCPIERGSAINTARVRIGDPHGPVVRIAVCPVHDTEGPVEMLPDELQRAIVLRFPGSDPLPPIGV